jgi:hypothetical protein
MEGLHELPEIFHLEAAVTAKGRSSQYFAPRGEQVWWGRRNYFMAPIKLEDPLVCPGDNLQQVRALRCKPVSYCPPPELRRCETHCFRHAFDARGGESYFTARPLEACPASSHKTRSPTCKPNVNQSRYATPLSDFLVEFQDISKRPKNYRGLY